MYLFYIDESGNLDINFYVKKPLEWVYTPTDVGLFEYNWRRFYLSIVERKRELAALIRKRTG